MTIMARLMALCPALLIAGFLANVLWLCTQPGPLPLASLLALIYLAPVLAFRVHQAIWPMVIGDSDIGAGVYVPWWGAHQLQVIYIAVPQLEALLRVVPGLYSAWLRLWGARVGRRVYWTPLVDIGDRSLLEIGDGAIFGHRATLYAHIITPQKKTGTLILQVKPIVIEAGAFVGAGTALGPGVIVRAGKMVKAGTNVYPNTEVK
jgi:hypothetical protein